MKDDTIGVASRFHPSSLIQYAVSMTQQVVIAVVVGALGATITVWSAAGGIRLTNPALLLGALLVVDSVLRFMMLPHAGDH